MFREQNILDKLDSFRVSLVNHIRNEQKIKEGMVARESLDELGDALTKVTTHAKDLREALAEEKAKVWRLEEEISKLKVEIDQLKTDLDNS